MGEQSENALDDVQDLKDELEQMALGDAQVFGKEKAQVRGGGGGCEGSSGGVHAMPCLASESASLRQSSHCQMK